VTAEVGMPVWALVATGGLAGAAMPSLGAMVRARWSMLLAGTSRLHTAFSLESVADNVIFVIGPMMVTLLATDVYPVAGIGTATLLGVTGTLAFTRQHRARPTLPRSTPASQLTTDPPHAPFGRPRPESKWFATRRAHVMKDWGGQRIPASGLLILI